MGLNSVHKLEAGSQRDGSSDPLRSTPRKQSPSTRPKKLAEVGWIWEGQGLVGGVDPSIFGVGEGAEYFGLKNVCYMFHPNDELAMEKLRGFESVVCDIAKWKFRRTDTKDAKVFEGGGEPELVPAVRMYRDGHLETMVAEAKKVAQLSLKYPNVLGTIDDELLGNLKREGMSVEQYGTISKALKSINPNLKHWAIAFDFDLNSEKWPELAPYLDVINIWVWNSYSFSNVDEVLNRCKKVFGEKPIILGCYLRDFYTQKPMPLDSLKLQWEHILRLVESGAIDGYSILAACLIDGQPEQARWVRDFISAH